MLFAIVLLLVGGCNEKSQNYFTGIILKITDNYFIVSPDVIRNQLGRPVIWY